MSEFDFKACKTQFLIMYVHCLFEEQLLVAQLTKCTTADAHLLIKGDLHKSASGPVKHLPNMHEHIAEEPPDLCSVSGMIHQRTLHEIWLVRLQHPFIEHHAVRHKHYDLKQTQTHSVLNL